MFEQGMLSIRDNQLARSRDRHLALLRAALLDQHYLDNEVRIEYLLGRARDQLPVSADLLRAPQSFLRKEFQRLQQAREFGQTPDAPDPTAYFPYTTMGAIKLRHLDDVLGTIRDEKIPGDLVDCEPGRGGAAVYMRGFLEANEIPKREVWVAGRFPVGARETARPRRSPSTA